MDAAKLKTIIANKNDTLERHTLNTAEDIIEEIVRAQQTVTKAQERIIELRKQLTTLEIPQLDSTSILGEV